MVKLNRDHLYEIRCDECGLILEKSQSDKSSEKKKLIMKHRFTSEMLLYTDPVITNYKFQEDLCPECKKKREGELADIKVEILRLSYKKDPDVYIKLLEDYGFFIDYNDSMPVNETKKVEVG